MFNPLNIDAPFDSLQFIQNLQAYNVNKGVDEMLDLMREIQQSGNYFWQGLSFPNGAATTIAANATLNGTIQVPQGSYVTSITHFQTVDERAGFSGGFKVKLYDKGSKASIFYGDYSLERNFSSNMQLQYGQGTSTPPSDPGMNGDNPFGPAYLMSPFIVTNPGILGWEVVNLNNNSQVFQMLLAMAIPINKQSVSQKVVTRGY